MGVPVHDEGVVEAGKDVLLIGNAVQLLEAQHTRLLDRLERQVLPCLSAAHQAYAPK